MVKRLHEKEVWEGSSFLQGPSFSYLVIRYFLLVYSSNQQSSPCNRSISSKPIQSHLFFMKTQFKLVCLSYPDTASGGPKVYCRRLFGSVQRPFSLSLVPNQPPPWSGFNVTGPALMVSTSAQTSNFSFYLITWALPICIWRL